MKPLLFVWHMHMRESIVTKAEVRVLTNDLILELAETEKYSICEKWLVSWQLLILSRVKRVLQRLFEPISRNSFYVCISLAVSDLEGQCCPVISFPLLFLFFSGQVSVLCTEIQRLADLSDSQCLFHSNAGLYRIVLLGQRHRPEKKLLSHSFWLWIPSCPNINLARRGSSLYSHDPKAT